MTLLLLAGTGEARVIAEALRGRDVIASFAGATADPPDLGLPTRSGGFGGAEAFARFLDDAGITAVLDATHPFADRISARTQAICTAHGLPYALVLRPPWQAGAGDDWHFFDDEASLAAHIPIRATVFLGTGRQGLDRFANLAPRRVICRRIDPPRKPFPFPGGDYLVGRPPFSVEDEIALFRRLGVDWLVVKNSGGTASRSKLDAARALGIAVALKNRPAQPPGLKLPSVEAALDWVRGL